MRLGAVVLTTGQRPAELDRAVTSLRGQRGVDVHIVVVLNTDADLEPEADLDLVRFLGVGPGDDLQVVSPGRNLGIPAGRNLGVAHLTGTGIGASRIAGGHSPNEAPGASQVPGASRAPDAIVFLDDDARLATDDVLRQVAGAFDEDSRLAIVTMRLRDPVTGATERRHVPRLRVGDPARSSWVTTFLGGACVIRTSAFVAAGGLPDEFFYAHEETSLAWRVIDAGGTIRYRGDLVVEHPAAAPSRHADFHRLSARNRVLLAHLHLPLFVAAVYVGTWTVLSAVRAPRSIPTIVKGIREGLAMRHLPRQPIRWRTLGVMTRYGRPPLL